MTQTDEIIKEFSKDPEWKKGFEEESRKLDAAVLVTQLRDSVGVTQEILARKAGVSKSTVARIENGNMNPTLTMLNKLANATGKKLKISFN